MEMDVNRIGKESNQPRLIERSHRAWQRSPKSADCKLDLQFARPAGFEDFSAALNGQRIRKVLVYGGDKRLAREGIRTTGVRGIEALLDEIREEDGRKA